MNKKSLGRGLSSLLSDNNIELNVSHENHRDEKGNSYHRECYVEALEIRQSKLDLEIAEQTLKNLKKESKKS